MHKRRRPRALTLTLPDEKHPYLLFEGRRYALRNFNDEGIGLWVPEPAPFGLAKGSQISGDIVIGEAIHSVTLEIRHYSARLIGMRIVHKSPELTKLFKELMEPATYAHDLRFHAHSGTLDPSNGFHRLWMTAPGAEMIVWYQEFQKSIMGLQVTWAANWVFRPQLKMIETGFMHDDTRLPQGRILKDEDILIRHPKPDEDLVRKAAQFLNCIPQPMPGYLLWQFLETGEQVFLPADLFARLNVA